MEAKEFFVSFGKALLKAGPYLILAAQVIDLINRGLENADGPLKQTAKAASVGGGAESSLPPDIQ